MEKYMVVFGVLLAGILLFGCTSLYVNPSNTSLANQTGTQMANPASVNCVNNGGTLQIVTADDGSQSGMCTLANGHVCEEWAYYRGECS